jgi:hypothetical protein
LAGSEKKAAPPHMHMKLGFILDSGLEEEGNLALHGVFQWLHIITIFLAPLSSFERKGANVSFFLSD